MLSLPERTPFGAAVLAGLDALPATGPDDEWLWLLHDDSRPAPDALEQLLAAAAANPSADVLGPKLREWPSLRRLLEVGITMSGTGRRETGLERGEYDQGQHDRIRDVLAVNTAGMLVRRSVFMALGGFDKRLPMFGNDLDFGWRAARAGHRTLVVPEAVLFHVEAAHRGVRRTRAHHRHPSRRAPPRCHAAGQLPARRAAVPAGPALPRQPAARARSAPGPRPARRRRAARRLGTYARPRIVAGPPRAPGPATVRPATCGTCSHRPGCPTGTGSTSSPTWRWPSPPRRATTSARRAARTEAVEAGPRRRRGQNLPEDTGLWRGC